MGTNKGPLHTKLKPRHLPLLADTATQLAVIQGWKNEDHEKLSLLCAEMGVPDGPNRFYDLSLALARNQYAGFQQAASKTKWNDLTRGYLVVEIERLTASGTPVKAAAKELAKRPEWKSFVSKTLDGGEGLRVQYGVFQHDPWASVVRDAFKLHQHEDRLPEWHAKLLLALLNPHPPTRR